MRRIKVGLFYNLKEKFPFSPNDPSDLDGDWDTIETFNDIETELNRLGYHVVHIGAPEYLLRADADKDIDVAFNMCEMRGYRYREALAPGLFELCSIPYTFSPPDTMIICLDKNLANFVVQQAGCTVPHWFIARSHEELCARQFDNYPYIVKPSAEGSGMGIQKDSVVWTYEAILEQTKRINREYKQPALVQEFVSGREFTIGVIEYGSEVMPLEPLELLDLKSEHSWTYNYPTKVLYDRKRKLCPLTTDEFTLREEIRRMSSRIFTALGCRDAARIDIRLSSNGVPFFLEANTLPYFHRSEGDFCLSAFAFGINYGELLHKIISNALQREHTKA